MAYDIPRVPFPYSYANTTFSELLYTLGVRILEHPWVCQPRIFRPDGEPVAINRVRLNLGGIEPQNQQGVTMTIAPYSFTDSLNPKLSATSVNASYKAVPQGTGRGSTESPTPSWDLVTAYILVTLSMFKFELKDMPRPEIRSPQTVVFQTNPCEHILMDYAVMLKHIITDHLRTLRSLDCSRDLVEGLTVEWIDFPSADWTKGANAVNHVAHILVCAQYRECTAIAVDTAGFFSQLSHQVGDVPAPENKAQRIPVGFDPLGGFYFRMDTNPFQPLTIQEITDPSTGRLYSTINTSTISIHGTAGRDVVTEVVTMDPADPADPAEN